VKDHLELVTTNASIDVDVTLLSNATARKPTRLSLLNLNGTINADVKLVVVDSAPDAKFNGSFAISAITKGAPVDLKVTSLPSNAFLSLRAANRFAPVVASVPPSYEGKFLLITPGGESLVKFNEETPDPEGEGRTRDLNIREISGRVILGNVKWVESKKDAVTVEARASEEFDENDFTCLEDGCDDYPAEETVDMVGGSRIELVSAKTNVLLDLN
jgi:hypothetical protein